MIYHNLFFKNIRFTFSNMHNQGNNNGIIIKKNSSIKVNEFNYIIRYNLKFYYHKFKFIKWCNLQNKKTILLLSKMLKICKHKCKIKMIK